RCDSETKMEIFVELLTNRGNYTRRFVSDVQAADASGEIEIAITVNIFDHGAAGAGGEDRRGVRGTTRYCGFAPRHQSSRLRSRNFRTNLNCGHISTIRSEFRRDSRKPASFPDILPIPTGQVRGQNLTVCIRPRAPLRTWVACG